MNKDSIQNTNRNRLDPYNEMKTSPESVQGMLENLALKSDLET